MITAKNKKNLFLFVFFTLPFISFSHPNDDYLNTLSTSDVFYVYLKLGFTHIIPLGFDHILFILSLFLLSTNIRTLFWQSLAFTIAHTITLGFSAYGKIDINANIVEPLIALSIFFVAAENIITDKLKPTRIIIVFLFGLIHGLGFAGILSDIGLPKDKFFQALITFNVGVELGQIAIIITVWWCFSRWFHKKAWYRTRFVYPVSAISGIIAIYWTIERVFFV